MGATMGNDAEVRIGADATGLEKGMNDAMRAVQAGVSNMQNQFGGLGKTFEGLQGKFLALTAILGGGKLFKEAIGETVDMAKEALKLSRVLGISATEASVLSVALNDIYQSADQVTTGTAKITKTLNTNEEAFKKLGVATRDQNGHFRNAFDIMLDVNKRLGEFKEGTDRNIEAQKIYGKSFQDMLPIIALTGERMEESRKKAESLGLTLGVEGAEKVSKYRASMNDLNDMFSGISKAIGEALMPVLSDMADFFSQYGPQAVQVMKVAMATLVSAFYGLKMVVEIAWETVKAGIQQIVVALMTLAEVGYKALKFDFTGAKEAWTRGTGQMLDIGREWGKKIVADAENNRDKLFKTWSSALNPQTAIKKNNAGATSEGGTQGTSSADKTRMASWEAELSETKAALTKIADAQGQYREMTANEERAFWQRRLVLAKGNASELASVTKKLGDLEVAGIRDKYAAQLESLKTEEVAVGNNFSAKRAIVMQEMALYDQNGKQYAALKKHLAEIDQQSVEQQQRLSQMRAEATRAANLEVISIEEETARFQVEMGLKTNEELLLQQQQFEQRRYVIKLQALQDELALMAQDPGRNVEQIAKLNEQKEELERQHQARMTQIQHQATAAQTKDSRALFDSMGTAFGAMVNSLMTGATSMRKALTQVFQSIYQSFISTMVTKPLSEWIAMQAKMLAAKLGFLTAEKSAQIAGSAATVGVKSGEAMAVVGANAAEAASGAAASQASIPYVGPVLAIAAFAAIMAMVLGAKSSVKSAAGGYDVPRGLNPMTQIHEEEMVLPKQYANVIRGLASGGGESASSGAPVYINTTGGDWIHKKDLAGLLKKMNRNFVTIK